MVAYWPTKRPVPVSKCYVDPDGNSQPRSPHADPEMIKQFRETMKEEMAGWPRDERGCWVKK
jgi:hypothetical protein